VDIERLDMSDYQVCNLCGNKKVVHIVHNGIERLFCIYCGKILKEV